MYASLNREIPLFSVERVSKILRISKEDLGLVIPTSRGVEVMTTSGQSFFLGTHNFKFKVGKPILRNR